MIIIPGGVTAPKGFLASGVKAGIKKSGKKDLALICSEVPAVAAGAFTANVFKASPVKVSLKHITHKTHQAVIVNSGNANCANGRAGDRDALSMARFAAETLALKREAVLVASTGIIGRYLPIEKIRKAVPALIGALSEDGGASFAEAIMTTDTKKKEIAVKVKLGGSVVAIGGACKGVGMIYPEIKAAGHATMLCFITTDAAVSKKMLGAALDEAVADSFNMVSVDGDMSTNDMCLVLANGMAGNRRIAAKNRDYAAFASALKFVATELAKKMARDGEGATKFIEIKVTGAKTAADAKDIARKVSTSTLLKCAVFGGDPNWGRVVAAAGASGVAIDPGTVDIYLGGVKVLSNGMTVRGYDLKKAEALFKKDAIDIKVGLKSGKHEATAWTCDLSHKYVEINSEYST
ncbi:MAG: bifunctional glutamate N-acetyltransferase/amino-acid acetyltransferase ArgJ [Candidatus Omnitrophica bacterium]|nr:bifunctional glutamate N-acetyltransferase/amino-acid acetyltransferase ArgJ [Candidatus Omnitrophota bacterium]